MTDQQEPSILIVRGGTDCQKLGAAIAGRVERGIPAIVEFVGAGAGNQAIKGVIIANTVLSSTGQCVHVVPHFVHRSFADNPRVVGVQLRLIPFPL